MRSARLGARRIIQTPRAFSNWPSVLWAVGLNWIGRGPSTLKFRTRNGQSITTPNAPGARVPAYEMYAEDHYDLGWFVGDLSDRPFRVLDIGAHVGTFSCLLAGAHATATIDAFEPAPETARFLRMNLAENGLDGRVRVHEAALAADSGTVVLDVPSAASGHSQVTRDSGGGTEVRTASFDDAVRSAGGSVELVKLDCEGGEYSLYGSSPESWKAVQRVVLEYHPVDGASWAELRQWFAQQGLDVVREHPIPDVPDLGQAWLSR